MPTSLKYMRDAIEFSSPLLKTATGDMVLPGLMASSCHARKWPSEPDTIYTVAKKKQKRRSKSAKQKPANVDSTNRTKQLTTKISERSFTQRFDDSMSSFSSTKQTKAKHYSFGIHQELYFLRVLKTNTFPGKQQICPSHLEIQLFTVSGSAKFFGTFKKRVPGLER